MKNPRTFLNNSSGTAAAEMALVLPMLLALMFVAFEGGHYLYIEHQVVKGVRDGARFAARQAFSKYTCTTVDAALQTQIKEVTRTGKTSGGSTRVSGWANADVTVTATCPGTAVTTGIYSGMANAPRVTVNTSVIYPSLFKALGLFNSSTIVGARQQAAVMGL